MPDERRTPAKPGLRAHQQWPADLTVEYGPAVPGDTTLAVKGFVPKSYRVYVNGECIGTVSVAREAQHRPVSRGSRLVTSAGHRQVWREHLSRPLGGRWSSSGSPTRVEATSYLIQQHLASPS
jgi:hypothetical protein